MLPHRSLLVLSLIGLSAGFTPAPLIAPPETSSSKTSLFGTSTADDITAQAEISRRAALVTTSVLAAAGTLVVPNTADAYAPSIEAQVKAIESARYMGQLTRKAYEPNTAGAPEKHLPQVKLDGTNVEVSVPHVMTEEHYIQFMWLKDAKSEEVVLVKAFPPTDPSPPTLKARAPDGVVLRPYLFCNLHGLWKGEEFTVGAA